MWGQGFELPRPCHISCSACATFAKPFRFPTHVLILRFAHRTFDKLNDGGCRIRADYLNKSQPMA